MMHLFFACALAGIGWAIHEYGLTPGRAWALLLMITAWVLLSASHAAAALDWDEGEDEAVGDIARRPDSCPLCGEPLAAHEPCDCHRNQHAGE